MRVLLSTYGSRGDVEPLVALALQLREAGSEVRVCAPPDEDFAQRPASVGVPLVPVGQSARALTTSALTPETRARASAVAATIRTDGVAVAAKLLFAYQRSFSS